MNMDVMAHDAVRVLTYRRHVAYLRFAACQAHQNVFHHCRAGAERRTPVQPERHPAGLQSTNTGRPGTSLFLYQAVASSIAKLSRHGLASGCCGLTGLKPAYDEGSMPAILADCRHVRTSTMCGCTRATAAWASSSATRCLQPQRHGGIIEQRTAPFPIEESPTAHFGC